MSEFQIVLASAFVGAASALLATFFNQAISEAMHRRRIATQLGAYLSYWANHVLKDPALLKLAIMSKSLPPTPKAQNDRDEGKDNDKTSNRPESEDELWKSVQQAILQDKDFLTSTYDELKGTRWQTEYSLQEIDRFTDAILKNEVFITDEQAALLSSFAAGGTIRVRYGAVDTLSSLRTLAIYVNETDDLDDDKSAELIAGMLKSVSFLADEIAPLLIYTR